MRVLYAVVGQHDVLADGYAADYCLAYASCAEEHGHFFSVVAHILVVLYCLRLQSYENQGVVALNEIRNVLPYLQVLITVCHYM